MIKVIIADDELAICRLIQKLIDWEKNNLELVNVSNNGVEAIESIFKYKPDIVITDIRMPGYDGLEIIERTKKVNPNIEFIIISGYENFEYAKEAISYGVNAYLLKPINKDELQLSISRVKEKIIKRRDFINLENEYKNNLVSDTRQMESQKHTIEKGNFSKNLLQIEQAKEFIDTNYMKNITLESVGEYIGFNPSYLSSVFKRETGISFLEYLTRTRIDKAKILIKEPDLMIYDIAEMVGYTDIKHFSKLFKKHTGYYPKDFRKFIGGN